MQHNLNLLLRNDVSANTVLFWKTGVCGGFTTFPVWRNSDHNSIDPDSADLTYQLPVLVCLDALQLWRDDHQSIGICGLAYSQRAKERKQKQQTDGKRKGI